MKQIVLTGIKPTGSPHIGNYFGAIKPALTQFEEMQNLTFIADYHALTTLKNPKELKKNILEVAASWIALGLDPDKHIFYKQSDISEIFECQWILSCFAPKGLLNRAHAYKALHDTNIEQKKDPDKNINMGIYSYPVLMAADILLFHANIVPVGADQKQHVEIARDIAKAFNHLHNSALTLPEPKIEENVKLIPGIDGQKMSKNYNNTIPIFESESVIKKRIMQIKTDSKDIDEPKNPNNCNLFKLLSYFSDSHNLQNVKEGYENGGLGYGTVKKQLLGLVLDTFKDARETYQTLMNHPDHLESILEQGKQKAKHIAQPSLQKLKHHIGV